MELSKDFDAMFRLCSLVDSVDGAVLPEAGGWNDQDDEFVACWLIYKGEKSRKERNMIKNIKEGA